MPAGKQEDIMLNVDGKSMTIAEFGQKRRELDAKVVEVSDSSILNKSDAGYDAIAEQYERHAAVLGIDSALPSGNTESKTVTQDKDYSKTLARYNSDRFTTGARTSDKNNELLTFPDDLATDGKNRYWTKITVYEVRYNKDSESSGANSKLKIYKKGKLDESAQFTGEVMSARKYAYSPSNNKSVGSSYTNNYVMTNLTIALPMPTQDPQWEFMLNWGDNVDWGVAGGIMELLNEIGGKDWDAAKEETKNLGAYLVNLIKQKLPVAGQVYKSGQKEFVNDRTELLFNGFGDTRRPSFSWMLYPKNQKESETLLNIIETLKSLVLPAIKQTASTNGNKNMLMFPAVFEICFMNGDQENVSMPRFGPLGVASFKITSINDKWQAHKDGSPIGYQIDMMGVELVHPIRDNLEDDQEHLYIR